MATSSTPQVGQRKPKPHSNLRKRVKARQNKGGKKLNKVLGNRGPGHPPGSSQSPAFQSKVVEMWMNGMSVAQIARETEKAYPTITRIVKAEDMATDAVEVRRQMYEKVAENILARVNHEIGDIMSKDGAWMAVEIGEQLGILPGKIQKHAALIGNVGVQEPLADKDMAEEVRVTSIAMRLAKAAVERGKLFGMKMPEIDAIDMEEQVKVPARKEK